MFLQIRLDIVSIFIKQNFLITNSHKINIYTFLNFAIKVKEQCLPCCFRSAETREVKQRRRQRQRERH